VFTLVITSLAIIIVILVFRHNKNKYYKKKFMELMDRSPVRQMNTTNGELDINPEVAQAILTNLIKFEQNRKYLEKDMNLVKMATLLNTNTKYVTKIIAHYRGKGTIEYISDLKIDYIIERLKNESKYRNYTNKALGEEAGFGSTQNFTKAFKAKTDISPTYFIEMLRNGTYMRTA
ncbi:MAG TPA: helix-turn-helix domain-containing protein, partial [Chryseolinea sp.]|nr:helix-turn-helix domain-containing protein [Chryseolinea sp.]